MSQRAFDHETIHRLLTEVADELQRQRAHGSLYVIGGAAIALAYDGSRLTQDIDGLISGDHGKVVAAIQTVAHRYGMPGTWLNEQATAYMPKASDFGARSVFYHPHLEVKVASREHLVAMKLVVIMILKMFVSWWTVHAVRSLSRWHVS